MTGSKYNTDPILTWTYSGRADGYEYCLDQTNDSSCSTWIPTGLDRSLTVTGLTDGVYYWQVRSYNANGYTYGNGFPESFWALTVDKTPPSVLSISLLDPDPNTLDVARYSVKFSSIVTGVAVTDFSLTASGITSAAVTAVSGTGATYTVSVDTGTGSGTLSLNVLDRDTILDAFGNPLGGVGTGNGNYSAGPHYTIDRNGLIYSGSVLDGWVLESGENTSVGGTFGSTGGLFVGDNSANKQYRSILSFNTSGLPNNATIVSVTLKINKVSITGTDPFTTHGALLADIRKTYFGTANALEALDFQAASTKLAVGSFKQVNTSAYQMTLSAADYANINLVGLTQFRLRFKLDDNNDLNGDFYTFYSGSALPVTLAPQLIVEYTLP